MAALKYERVWTQKNKYDDAEREYHTTLARLQNCNGFPPKTDPDDTIYPQPIFPTDCNSALIDLDRNEKTADSNPPKKSKKERKRSNNSQTDNKVLSAIENPMDMSIDKPLRAKEAKEKRNKADRKSLQMKEVASLDVQLKEIMSADHIVIQPQVQVVAPATISPKKSRKSKKDKSKSKSPPKEVASAPINVIDPIAPDVKDNKFDEENDRCDSGNRIQRCVATKTSPPMKGETPQAVPSGYSLAQEVAKARQHIKNSLECMDSVAELAGSPNEEVINKLNSLEKANADLHRLVESLESVVIGLQRQVQELAGGKPGPAAKPREDSDDGVDLFASDSDDDQEAAKVREQRLAAYAEKKSKKPVLIAKSNIILDVKTWSDEIDMKELETEVRKVKTDGLLWGASKLVPLAFGVHKLQISCVVEDDKVSVDWLQEEIEKLEDLVQSVDIAAFNKV